MKITVSHSETNFNRATRRTESVEVSDGFAVLPSDLEIALRRTAGEYCISTAEMVRLVLCYYFGDGADHFTCEHCDFVAADGVCKMPLVGEQTTMPILDIGMVVVGLPTDDQGKQKKGVNHAESD